jgi:hypothetical protein
MLPIFFLTSIISFVQFNTYIDYVFKKHEDLYKHNKKCRSLINENTYIPYKFSRIEYIFIILYQFVYFLFCTLMFFYGLLVMDYTIENIKKIKGSLMGDTYETINDSFPNIIKKYVPFFSSFFETDNPNSTNFTFLIKILKLIGINFCSNLFLIFSIIMLNGGKLNVENKKKVKTEFYILSFLTLFFSCLSFLLF